MLIKPQSADDNTSETEKLVKKLADVPVVADALREKKAQQVAQRLESLAALQSARDQRASEMAPLIAAEKSAAAELAAAEASLRDAKLRHSRARDARFERGQELDRAENRHLVSLRATVGNEIDAFIENMLDFLATERHVIVSTQRYGRASYLSMKRSLLHMSNRVSVETRRLAIRAAIDEAEKLRLEPDPSVIPERLKMLEDGLPPLSDEMVPDTGSAPATPRPPAYDRYPIVERTFDPEPTR